MKRVAWMCLLLIALPLAGCSDDDPADPVEEPDPLSRLEQVGALADGTAWAVGVEGSTGRLYTNAAGTWGPAADQGPLGSGITPTGVAPGTAGDVFVYAEGASAVNHFSGVDWTTENLAGTVTGGGRLYASDADVYLLESGGGNALLRGASTWSILFGVDVPASRPQAAVVNGDGHRFVAFTRTGSEDSAILRSAGGTVYDDPVTGTLTALAAAGGDTVWAAGDRLVRYHAGSWTLVDAMPDTQQVVAIGVPSSGVLTLVCRTGLIYRWSADTFTLLQEFALVEPLHSVAYVRDDLIYGVVNQIESNTGHEVGLVVRYDGTQWNTDFLAPPAIP